MTIVEIVAGPVSSGIVSGTIAIESPASTLSLPSARSLVRLSAGCAFSICSDDSSSSMPPPTWNDASEMPKNSMMRRPAMALTAMTQNALIEATRIVRRRCSRLKPSVKWMKNGSTPIGLTIASSATSGFRMSIGWPGSAGRIGRAIVVGERAQVAQPGDGARAVPAEPLAVDTAHARARAHPLRFLHVLGTKRERLRAEQDLVDLGEPRFAADECRIAGRAGEAAGHIGQRLPADPREHAREVGVARDRHPRPVPDQVEDATLGSACGRRRRELAGEGATQRAGVGSDPRLAGERRRQLVDQGEVVFGVERMRDDDLRGSVAPSADRLDRLAPVLVDVDEDVRRRQPAQPVEADVLGAADLGDGGDLLFRADAKAGAGDQPLAETEGEGELGQARNQAGDARRSAVGG